MKLFQYEFQNKDDVTFRAVGEHVKDFFAVHNEHYLLKSFSGKFIYDKKIFKKLNISSMSGDVYNYLKLSCKRTLTYGEIPVIISMTTCRFIVFEDDGVMRVCYKSCDNIIDLSCLNGSCVDISELLILTDLFDDI